MRRRALLLATAASCAARAQPLSSAPAPAARLREQPGAALPLALPFVDSEGRKLTLADCFDPNHCVLLVPGYYRCPQLCGLLMHALLEGLQRSGAPRTDWRIVGISIDPQDTPATARARRDLDLAYADFLLGAEDAPSPLDLRLLVGGPASIARFAQSVGFTSAALPASGDEPRFTHPTTVIAATPQGRIARYLPGLQFDPGLLRNTIAAARRGETATALSEQLALPCGHPEPRWGARNAMVMDTTRAVALAAAGGLAAWCWHRRRA
jgi:protein SCO1/2